MIKYRYDLTITHDASGATVNTFTWGATYMEAFDRVIEEFTNNPETWGGWSFDLDPVPTAYEDVQPL